MYANIRGVGDAFIYEIFQKPSLVIYSKSPVEQHISEIESAGFIQ